MPPFYFSWVGLGSKGLSPSSLLQASISLFSPLSLCFILLFLSVFVLWVMLWHAVVAQCVKSPWNWNALTSTFKLDCISTVGSDKRVCVQRSQVTGLWRRGGGCCCCFESAWRWALNEKSDSPPAPSCSLCCWTLKQCLRVRVETRSWFCGKIKIGSLNYFGQAIGSSLF